MTGRCLVDTNVLLRVARRSDAMHRSARGAIVALVQNKVELLYSLQNIAEFWNVATRPITRNGFGLAVSDANKQLEIIESGMSLLPDTPLVYRRWRELLIAHSITGVQVHDARLVALMQVHSVEQILTFNGSDFSRFSGLRVINPEMVAKT